MIVKNFMIEKERLVSVSIKDTVERALEVIEENALLSIPVMTEDGKDLAGSITKAKIYEELYKNGEKVNKAEVGAVYQPRQTRVERDSILEDSSIILQNEKHAFIPVYEKEQYVGILTHREIFRAYTKLLGVGRGERLSFFVTNMSGRLAILTTAVADLGGDILNLIVEDVEVLNTARIVLRVERCDIDKLIEKVKKRGFKLERID